MPIAAALIIGSAVSGAVSAYSAKKNAEVGTAAAKAQSSHDDALLRAEQQRYATQQAALAPYQQATLQAMQSLGGALQGHYPAFGGAGQGPGPGMPPPGMPPPGGPPPGGMPPPQQMPGGPTQPGMPPPNIQPWPGAAQAPPPPYGSLGATLAGGRPYGMR